MDKGTQKLIVIYVSNSLAFFLDVAIALWIWNYFAVHLTTFLPILNYWQMLGIIIVTNTLFNKKHFYQTFNLYKAEEESISR